MAGSQYIVGGKGDTGPQGPPVSDGDKGDIVVSGAGTVYTIDAGVVTYAKMQNVAAHSVIGNKNGSPGVAMELSKSDLLTLINVSDGANVITDAFQTLTNKQIILEAGAAGATLAPLYFKAGSPMTVAETGAMEFDGVSLFYTINASQGRGQVPVEQMVSLTAAGSAITTIANFFGTSKNPVLVPSALYEIEIYLLFLKGTAGTVTLTLNNSAAPNWQNVDFEMSPVTGIVAPPGTATPLKGQLVADATAALAITTASLTDAVNHYMRVKMRINDNTGTNLQIQATVGTGQITPLKGSFWRLRRLSLTDTGNFAA